MLHECAPAARRPVQKQRLSPSEALAKPRCDHQSDNIVFLQLSVIRGKISKNNVIHAIFTPENLHRPVIPAISMAHDFAGVAPTNLLKRFRHFSAASRRRHADLAPRNLRWCQMSSKRCRNVSRKCTIGLFSMSEKASIAPNSPLSSQSRPPECDYWPRVSSWH